MNHSYEPWGPVNAIVRIGGASGRWTTPDGRLISLSHYNGPSFTLDTYWAFTHNPAGQIATQWGMSDAYAWTGAYAVQRPYTTNGLNQYSQTGSGAATAAFTYDANGNLATQTVQNVTQTYVYDIENRLVGAPGNVALTYDPLGRLYSVSSPTTDTRFLYDGDALVGEYNVAGTLQTRYVHDVGADVPVIRYEGTTVSSTTRRYLLANAQGSIVASTDGSSVIQNRNTYDEYGIPGVGNVGRFQYTGQIWLPELGMYHYKARIYSPTLGRFLQTDPIGYEDQTNLYAYVGNDPVNGTDRTGQFRNCPPPDTNCIETPESAQQPGPPPPPSPEETEVQEVIVTGKQPQINHGGLNEEFFTINNHVMTPQTMNWQNVLCPDGSTQRVGTRSAVPVHSKAAHSHGNGADQYPGPRDDNAAQHSEGGVAGVMTHNRSFTIRVFSNGTYRVRQTEGPAMTASEHSELIRNMRRWEQHPDPGPSQSLAARVCH